MVIQKEKQPDLSIFQVGDRVLMKPLTARAKEVMLMSDGMEAMDVTNADPAKVLSAFPDDFIANNAPHEVPEGKICTAMLINRPDLH